MSYTIQLGSCRSLASGNFNLCLCSNLALILTEESNIIKFFSKQICAYNLSFFKTKMAVRVHPAINRRKHTGIDTPSSTARIMYNTG